MKHTEQKAYNLPVSQDLEALNADSNAAIKYRSPHEMNLHAALEEQNPLNLENFYNFEAFEGVKGLSFLVLNKDGTLLKAGRKMGPEEDDESPFLILSEGMTAGENEFTHGYIVVNATCSHPGLPPEMQNVQILLMQSFVGENKDSAHSGITFYLNLPRIKKIFAPFEYDVKVDFHFSGECKSKLTVGYIRNNIGRTLHDMFFNTKGTKTEEFKIEGTKKELTSYIPERCMVLDNEYDRHLILNASKTKVTFFINPDPGKGTDADISNASTPSPSIIKEN
ncbi:Uncharacterised protein [Legionella wadsworthii]|uniref:Uncharacterized protein n=1 Tax=Legionella wadsworthii TaxID=28088 RepID=A0A378LNU0_9GAMM|nr:hypothetical protein [Legionella wadsworthii]STY28423.1 Uncharacterised protein [Legionella wadsworthii]